jgi:FkbM family methyltransferase
MRRPVSKIVLDKWREVIGFCRGSQTPLSLVLDTLRLKGSPFIAIATDGIKLELRPRRGESFTFFENLVRRDYLKNGMALYPGAVVIDVGANIGSFTLLAASIVGVNGRVYAFEPVGETFARLERNISLNRLRNVVPCREAVGGEEGSITINTHEKSAYASATATYEHTGAAETVRCSTVQGMIDRYRLERVDFLKVDCEGSEYEIFRSMTPSTASKICQIAMEVHPTAGESEDALEADLRALGFSVRRFGWNWYATRPGFKAGGMELSRRRAP